jgi:hypothetical protein
MTAMHGSPAVLKVPTEISERILTMTDPSAVAAVSQSCSFFRDLIHRPKYQNLWRALFLARFDDPRPTFTIQRGESKKYQYPWSSELKRRFRSETLMTRWPFASLSQEHQAFALQTLTDVICSLPSPDTSEHSQDLDWAAQLITASGVLKVPRTGHNAELITQLHVFWGLLDEERCMPTMWPVRTAARLFVYDVRKHNEGNGWGPYLPNRPGKVSWVHIDHIFNAISMNLEEIIELCERMRPPTGLNAMRPYSAPCVDNIAKDWAGVEGNWYRYVCFMDYRFASFPSILFQEPCSCCAVLCQGSLG